MLITNDWFNVLLGLSLRSEGSMKHNIKRQDNFLKKVGLESKLVARANLVHGNRALALENLKEDTIFTACDALISSDPRLVLTLTVADCLPVYFYDEKKGVIGLAHAGWRGLVAGILDQVLEIFIERYKSSPADIKVFIGPHIKSCHFEVQDDVLSSFDSKFIVERNQKTFINLSDLAQSQILKKGLKEENIKTSPDCTYCLKDRYFSYRRGKSKNLKTMLAFISLNFYD